jgi:hypothetical protein
MSSPRAGPASAVSACEQNRHRPSVAFAASVIVSRPV